MEKKRGPTIHILMIVCSILFATAKAAAEGREGSVRFSQPIPLNEFGEGTSFHTVLMLYNGQIFSAWSPGNNIGPDGVEVSRYNWATDADGVRLPENETTKGNGGHRTVAIALGAHVLDPTFSDDVRTKVEEAKKKISQASEEVQAKLSSLKKDRVLFFRLRQQSKSAPETLDPTTRATLALISEVEALFASIDQREERIRAKLADIYFVGGHIEIRKKGTAPQVFVRITSRSAVSKSSNLYKEDIIPYLRAVESTSTYNQPGGYVPPELRSTFIREVSKLVPDSSLIVAPEAYADLDPDQRLELERTLASVNCERATKNVAKE